MLGNTKVALVAIAALAVPAAATPALATNGGASSARTSAVTASAAGTMTSRVVGHWAHGTVTGHFTPTRFVVVPRTGRVMAHGDIRGAVRRADGSVRARFTRTVNLPVRGTGTATRVAAAAATCQILHLTLGPLDLNLLGLVIHLDRVVLNIDAQSGAGNLLGNLLCAVAGLLDGSSTLADLLNLSNLLNRILNLLHL
jgi:hypothetical protein